METTNHIAFDEAAEANANKDMQATTTQEKTMDKRIEDMTAEELRALAEKKDAAAREEQRKLEEEARRKEQEERNKKQAEAAEKRFRPTIDAITAAIQAQSPKANIVSGISQWHEDAVVTLKSSKFQHTYCSAEIKMERTVSHSRFHSGTFTGKLRVTVGEYGDRQTYPQRKDGTFNLVGIAERMINQVKMQDERLAERARRQANSNASGQLAEELRNELNVSKYAAVRLYESTNTPNKVYVKVDVTHELTADEARSFIKALRSAGIEIKGDRS